MPLRTLNPEQARGNINPLASRIAQEFSSGELIAHKLLVPVATATSSGTILEGYNTRRVYDTRRAPGANAARISLKHGSRVFVTDNHSLDLELPKEFARDGRYLGLDFAQFAAEVVMEGVSLTLEKEIAGLLSDSANYAAANSTTLSGASQWSDESSNPIDDILEACEVVRKATGKMPNVGWCSGSVFKELRKHPKVISQNYFGTGVSGEISMLESRQVANAFGLEKLYVGNGIEDLDDGTTSEFWGRSAGIAIVPPETLAAGDGITYAPNMQMNPTSIKHKTALGYTYVMNGHPFVYAPYYEQQARTWYYGCDYERVPVFTGVNGSSEVVAGFVFNDAVAA